MLGTAGAVMPGGVLPPASGEDTKPELVSTGSKNCIVKIHRNVLIINKRSPKLLCKERDFLPIVSLFGKLLRKVCKTFFSRMKVLLGDQSF